MTPVRWARTASRGLAAPKGFCGVERRERERGGGKERKSEREKEIKSEIGMEGGERGRRGKKARGEREEMREFFF